MTVRHQILLPCSAQHVFAKDARALQPDNEHLILSKLITLQLTERYYPRLSLRVAHETMTRTRSHGLAFSPS